MKVNLINKYKDKWKKHLLTDSSEEGLYKYENLHNFRKRWDLSELDLSSMYAGSLKSSISGRLWGGTVDSPRSVMLQFIEHNKEYVRSAFRDLYNENKDLSMRVNRFSFHCDQLLEQVRTVSEKTDQHYHESPQMTFLYLCFNDPDRYPLYNYPQFSHALELFETKSIPEKFEVERFYKLTKAIYTIISKDEELIKILQSRIPEAYGIEVNYLMIDDFFAFCKEGK